MKRLPYKPVRIVGFLAPELKRRLKASLASKDLTFNSWLRGKAAEEVARTERGDHGK